MYDAFIQNFYHFEFYTNVHCISMRITKVVREILSLKMSMYTLHLYQVDHETDI